MTEKIIPPALNVKNFHCPHCKVLALQRWFDAYRDNVDGSGFSFIPNLRNALCDNCQKYSIWMDGKMIFPESSSVQEPNEDLDKDIKKDYLEAANILEKSPRGAAALLRLALQKLCVQLGERGENLNDDIASLVEKGLSVRIQQALDILRVIGNNSVHPGKIDVGDNKEIAAALFELINHIAETLLSEPKRVEQIYNSLPEEARQQIEERDKIE